MRRLFTLLATAIVTLLAALPSAADQSASPTVLRLDGIGPLRLGMTLSAARATGWLGPTRVLGCPGARLRIPYRPLSGPRAPAGVSGGVTFRSGHLRSMSFTRGVTTADGVAIGRTSLAAMARTYRTAGFSVDTHRSAAVDGIFAVVKRHGQRVITGFGFRLHLELAVLGIPGLHVVACS